MSDIKIRTIPRSNEKPAKAEASGPTPAPSRRVAQMFIGLSAFALIIGGLGYWNSLRTAGRQLAKAQVPRNPVDRVNASINRHLYDTHLMEQMRKRKSLLENQASASKGNEYAMLPEPDRSYGVQLDQENTSERLYQELNVDKTAYGDNIEEKINARLANRKWLNEMERAERINFVRNFIRQAYDRGYEVTLDANLVVVSVKKITSPKSVNIDQVLDRLAKQGQ